MSGDSLSRMSALGADGGVISSSLSLRESYMFSVFGLQDQGNDYTTKTLHFRMLFSIMLVMGISTSRIVKYRIEASWPMMI